MSNHLVFIIMDSCRFDSYQAAATPNMDRLAPAQRRYSYASWTSPSHYVMLMGLMPHESPQHVFASEVYKNEFVRWVDRLEVPDLSFKTFLPFLSLPKMLKDAGYRTVGRVSMPVLNQYTSMSQHFDDYKLMADHNDFAGMVEEIEFPEGENLFFFLNLGETHYPYMLTDAPRVSGVHGVFKRLGEDMEDDQAKDFFQQDQMDMLRNQQVRCVEYVDGLVGDLYKKAPSNTHFIITADHGELFGEDGYFGHGPIMHPKCFEVPFLEGRRPGIGSGS
ncbi:MAG: sulfatase-like hydrolase/transferase [Gammaproteobacteria bacterium]|nr:sulfatase-like hydrolase/transferase [Gammaproteobacteria bacterium]